MSTVLAPPVPCRLSRISAETPDISTLVLEPPDGQPATFRPGQFSMLAPFAGDEVPISVSGDPAQAETWTHTIRAVGAATRRLCSLRPGDPVLVRGPLGNGWPLDEAAAADLLLVAGGAGLAPLRPALYQIMARRRRYGRVALLYGARSPADLVFKDELASWRGRFDLEVEVTVDHAAEDWDGEVGVVTQLLPFAPFNPGETVALLCGPEVMMRMIASQLLARGQAADTIYLSLERAMKCGVGLCGACQLGPELICRDGPVFRFDRVEALLGTREL